MFSCSFAPSVNAQPCYIATEPVLLSSIIYLPATVAGVGLGMLVFEAISSAVFHRIAIVLMTLLGLYLLWK